MVRRRARDARDMVSHSVASLHRGVAGLKVWNDAFRCRWSYAVIQHFLTKAGETLPKRHAAGLVCHVWHQRAPVVSRFMLVANGFRSNHLAPIFTARLAITLGRIIFMLPFSGEPIVRCDLFARPNKQDVRIADVAWLMERFSVSGEPTERRHVERRLPLLLSCGSDFSLRQRVARHHGKTIGLGNRQGSIWVMVSTSRNVMRVKCRCGVSVGGLHRAFVS
jgi:hypothetical protein